MLFVESNENILHVQVLHHGPKGLCDSLFGWYTDKGLNSLREWQILKQWFKNVLTGFEQMMDLEVNILSFKPLGPGFENTKLDGKPDELWRDVHQIMNAQDESRDGWPIPPIRHIYVVDPQNKSGNAHVFSSLDDLTSLGKYPVFPEIVEEMKTYGVFPKTTEKVEEVERQESEVRKAEQKKWELAEREYLATQANAAPGDNEASEEKAGEEEYDYNGEDNDIPGPSTFCDEEW
ncbi:Protein of unknown function [Pyronema omphalodes CBS 100304]|uniref:Uncharacterized protein n=1 Tax=Pyronema omphalodes (strain CBS 100304) TaxID=1076935 RepID=U4L562_PYROM|nr:Protein of unknown function [Pyronema omphalodes CBS 100304]